MRIKRYLIKLFVFFAVILIILIPCEYGVRLIYPVYDPSGRVKFDYNNDYQIRIGRKDYSGRQIKNTGDYDTNISFNEYGFRDRKDIAQIKPDEFVVVGDSFSLGWGVDEDKRFSDLLGQSINKPVYNIAISNNMLGYSALLKYAESKGAEIQNVILGLSMENDLQDYSAADKKRVISPGRYAYLKSFLGNFALFNLFTTYIHSSPELRNYAVNYGLIIDNIDGMPKNRLDKHVLHSSVSVLNELKSKYNLLVVVIASRGLWAGNNRAVESEVHREFINLLSDNNINFIDLKLLFEASGSPLGYHFKNDGHWNENGHSLTAHEIASYLKQYDYEFNNESKKH